MSLSPEEKRKIVGFIAGWPVKPIFECDIIDDKGSDDKWDEVRLFLEECASALQTWVERELYWVDDDIDQLTT
jgi:hypothetical protein